MDNPGAPGPLPVAETPTTALGDIAAPPEPLPPPAEPSWPRMPWRAARRPVELSMPAWQRALIPFLIFATAFGIYQYDVDHPPIIIFDEAHYVKVARNYTNGIMVDPAWGEKDPRPQNFEHPPVGKYLIAAGIWLNGKPHNDWENQRYISQLCGHDNPECARDAKGWRFGSTVIGASGIVAAYLLAMRLFNSRAAGFFGAGLLMLDGMYFMHARLAMLDVFPTAFWLWAFALTFSPYKGGRWMGAVFFGLALGSKYYVLYLVPLFLIVQFLKAPVPKWRGPSVEDAAPMLPPQVAVASTVTLEANVPAAEPAVLAAAPVPPQSAAQRLRAAWEPARPWLTRMGSAVLLAIVIPFLVLLAAYGPYFYIWSQSGGVVFAIKQWMHVQVASFTWIYGGETTHPFSSQPWTWIPMIRPVYYYTFDYPNGTVGKMWSIGNPFIWWTGALAAVVAPVFVLVRFVRDHARHYLRWDFLDAIVYYPFLHRRDVAVIVGALFVYACYVPWFLVQRIVFIFYMTFVVPSFVILAAGLLGEQWERGGFPRLLTILYGVIAAVVFGLYYPVVTGVPIEKAQYEWIMDTIPWMNA
jgi:dolichyl-phosphate-mannose-protein mannosyltransferase